MEIEQLPDRVSPGLMPTAVEIHFLNLLNSARSNPTEYGRAIGLDLSWIEPSQPLVFNTTLVEVARKHSQDMNDRRYFSHTNLEGLTPGDRMSRAGVGSSQWGESISGGNHTPEEALRAFTNSAGHRNHLFAVGWYFREQNFVGIGIVRGDGPYQTYITINTASLNDFDNEWIKNLYQDLLNRTATVNEVEFWRSKPKEIVVDQFINSAEYKYNYVSALYVDYLNREPGQFGLQFWSIANANQVKFGLLSSNEYFGNSPDGFINKIYLDVLGRTPASWEISAWHNHVVNNRDQSVLAILFSQESRNRQVDEVYKQMLDRPADPVGLQYFSNSLLTNSLESVVKTLAYSEEYNV